MTLLKLKKGFTAPNIAKVMTKIKNLNQLDVN